MQPPQPADPEGASRSQPDITTRECRQRVLHIYHVENLYAAVVEAYIQWQLALVEAVIRAALSGEPGVRLRGHERCIQRLATLLQLASSYREGREWTCECNYCLFVCGLRNYLAHHWTRGHAEFAISGGRWTSGSIWTRQNNPDVDDNRGYAHTYAPHVSIRVVSKALKQRQKFDAAARTLGQGAARFNLVPVVDGYMRCLSAHCAAWRAENPVPTPGAHLDCRGLVDLLEMVHQLRKASAGRQPGTLGLAGGTWQ